MGPLQAGLHPVRALALLGLTGALPAVTWGLADASVGRVAAASAGYAGGESRPLVFADVIETLAGVAALGCSGWLFVASVLACWEALHGRPWATRDGRWVAPTWLRRMVVAGGSAALGVTLVATPSEAEPAAGPRVPVAGTPLVGLPVPDRAAGAGGRPGVRYTVAVGDSLWRIADRFLPPGSSAAEVAAACRLLHRTNRDRLGPDLDLIFPETTLHVPVPLSSGKDRP